MNVIAQLEYELAYYDSSVQGFNHYTTRTPPEDYKRKTYLLIHTLVPIDNNILVKEYNEISKCKELKIETEKIWHLKTTTVPVIIRTWLWSQMGQINMLTRYQTVPANIKYKKLHFMELLISLGEYYQFDWKISPKKRLQKQIHRILISTTFSPSRSWVKIEWQIVWNWK